MADRLTGKRILLGVTGSIAAYKAAELLRELLRHGAEVQVVMTAAAQRFITVDTMRTLSGKPVLTDMFAEPTHWNVEHVSLADWAQLVLIAPATANTMARLANGLADDLLCCLCLSTRAPLLIVPAMDAGMFTHPLTQGNMEKLVGLGYTVMETDEGALASGKIGKGRMIETDRIVAEAARLLVEPDMVGLRVVVTAGPTQEPIDEARFISNRSSGRMGYALAAAAGRRGAEVTLLSGPTGLSAPLGVSLVKVETATQMQVAALQHAAGADIVIGAAAVADFTPEAPAEGKIRRSSGTQTLTLQPTADIIAAVAALGKRRPKVVVGFAAEAGCIVEKAKEKLARKGIDLIVANDIGQEGGVFGTGSNQASLVFTDGTVHSLERMPKADLADEILTAARARLKEAIRRR